VPSNHSNKGFWKNSVGLWLLLFSATQVRNMLKAGTLREIRIAPSVVGVLKTDIDAFIAGLAQ
jgi:hypothetical protein